VKNNRIVLPDGMSYRLLVLRDQRAISLPVLRKIKSLVEAGAAVLGVKPVEATGLDRFPESDNEVRRLADALWGQGRVQSGRTAREVLTGLGVQPDFEFNGGDSDTSIDYIHRRAGEAEIYFVANRGPRAEKLDCVFRVAGRAPELWDAASGGIRKLPEYRQEGGRTVVPLEFSPCGSWFVVFREPAGKTAGKKRNFPQPEAVSELAGPWEVSFDPRWGGPKQVLFEKLVDWTSRSEEGIRFYSGMARYKKVFDAPLAQADGRLFLDLGQVRELAEIRLNGKALGIAWAPPFQVDVTDVLKPAGNVLEVEVVNFWPNRIIGDQSLPAEKRYTQTNIRKLTAETALMPSGLLGPVVFRRFSCV